MQRCGCAIDTQLKSIECAQQNTPHSHSVDL